MADAREPDHWEQRKLREWLLQIVRFAITRDPRDEAAAFAIADEIDALGLYWRPSAPGFFLRTSREICSAIVEPTSSQRTAVLRRHARRIEDARLRQAFQAAVSLKQQSGPRSKRLGHQRADLWKGLKGS